MKRRDFIKVTSKGVAAGAAIASGVVVAKDKDLSINECEKEIRERYASQRFIEVGENRWIAANDGPSPAEKLIDAKMKELSRRMKEDFEKAIYS